MKVFGNVVDKKINIICAVILKTFNDAFLYSEKRGKLNK